MGRLRFILFKVARLLPRKGRKPIYLVISILGLIAFFRVMLYYSRSVYLQSVQNEIIEVQHTLLKGVNIGLLITFLCMLIAWLGYKHYKQVKAAVSIGYIIILVLAILPILLPVMD